MKSKLEATMSKAFNAFISIIHAHTNTTSSIIMIDFHLFFSSIITFENNLEFSRLINDKVSCLVLISKSMTTNNNWLFPSWNKSWDVFNYDWFSKNSTIKNVSNCTIWTFPHFFKFEFFNSSLIGSNSSTFNTNFTLFNSIGSINSNLIISSISMLNTKIEVFNINV